MSKKTRNENVVVNPVCCIYHDAEQYLVDAELPGVKKEEIEIEATEHSFCVRGKKEDVLYSACYHLAHEIDLQKIEAKHKEGMLDIKLPFKEPIETVKIQVQ